MGCSWKSVLLAQPRWPQDDLQQKEVDKIYFEPFFLPVELGSDLYTLGWPAYFLIDFDDSSVSDVCSD